MHLLVVHYHWRPGGVRQVVETALRELAEDASPGLASVTMAAGQLPPADWAAAVATALGPRIALHWIADHWLSYASEWPAEPSASRQDVGEAVARLVRSLPSPCSVLLENPAVGRHPFIGRAMAQATEAAGMRLVCHHHDFFFDGRWECRREWPADAPGSLEEMLDDAVPAGPHVVHLAVSARDAQWLARGRPAAWRPNPQVTPARVTPSERAEARTWLQQESGWTSPLWLCPTRVLRRKNLVEAALLARLTNPDAGVVVTGAASSPAEEAYARALATSAAQGSLPLRFGVLAHADSSGGAMPRLPALMVACDRVVVCSLFEGFGLPVGEAAVLGAPTLARLAACPDARAPRGTATYDECRVPWDDAGGRTERHRQQDAWRRWQGAIPPEIAAAMPDPPWWLDDQTVPFSRLTLRGQLAVLERAAVPGAADTLRSLNSHIPLNPSRESSRPDQTGRSHPHSLPGTLSLAQALTGTVPSSSPSPAAPTAMEWLRDRLAWANYYPLLWPGGKIAHELADPR